VQRQEAQRASARSASGRVHGAPRGHRSRPQRGPKAHLIDVLQDHAEVGVVIEVVLRRLQAARAPSARGVAARGARCAWCAPSRR
jgi:hypothetical protein